MQKNNTLFRTISTCRSLKNIHELHQRKIESKKSILSFIKWIFEKFIMNDFLFMFGVFFKPFTDDHIVNALKGSASNGRIFFDDTEIFSKISFPVEFLISVNVVKTCDHIHQVTSFGFKSHETSLKCW